MNEKRAREILKPFQHYKKIPFYGMGEAHRVLEAKAFLEGYEAGIREAAEIPIAMDHCDLLGHECTHEIKERILSLLEKIKAMK